MYNFQSKSSHGIGGSKGNSMLGLERENDNIEKGEETHLIYIGIKEK